MNIADTEGTARTNADQITVERWGSLPGGDSVRLFTLRNAHGMRVTISDLGATLVSWHAADRAGRVADVLLGHDTPEAYFTSSAFMGGIIGRWANRIADARFVLDGVPYSLDRNEGPHHLHGGATGFHRALWNARESEGGLEFMHESPEGDAGFPGKVIATVRYSLDDDGALTIRYDAVADAPTPINMTNHAYFNLSGDNAPGPFDIRGHVIAIDADTFFETDDALIPVARAHVAGNAFDFRAGAPIGARLDWPDTRLARAGGFDHCYILPDADEGAVRKAAILYDPASGRELTVSTDAPGLQFYTGNFLEGVTGREGKSYRIHAGLCLEAGAFPNQINMPDASRVVLRPGERYSQTTRYRIGVR
ncbi:galactose mutarotase [Caballeronia sp. LZ062]|uniref:aldose epimerase family protein n=1 Tax=unclassified Caballeronia TaxID=2646786 RepID=UPI0028550F4C|nr:MULTISPECIES: aldose epimerase family protein [unclassified Caballeronia]MDR5857432.1 galactose mutarotase [Caballeronia sp. LZ050]MDR5868983.1 galactose mutarotase [Caballeronia sp. LZ062]